ncbi:MAG: GIY-YIG nuclease family protein [Chitinophagaceae bacterium]|nr:GIY-YIG nuclease family protein [Chitinophagaceae bacterium]
MKITIVGIYKITSPTGKVYIGQSIDIENRFRKYKLGQCKKQSKLYASFKKHKVETHTFQIIHCCPSTELDAMEIFYIKLYNSFNNDNGLNLKAGGSHGTHSDITKEAIGKAHKGKIVSEESRAKMRIAQQKRSKEISILISKRNIGNKNAQGRKLTIDEIQKLKESKKHLPAPMKGKKHTPESIEKMRQAKIGKKRICWNENINY